MPQRWIKILTILTSILFLVGCKSNEIVDDNSGPNMIVIKTMPENRIAYDATSGMKALYISPTSVYTHGILGDTIEAGGLLVLYNNQQYYYMLDSLHVFEDIQPRLADLDNDGIPEIITILTNITQGASIGILKIEGEKLILSSQNDYIGTAYRWLNIAAIDDLDNDGAVEIAYVTTPHIGGNLHVDRIQNNKLVSVAVQSGVSNHQIYSRNLCLSAITMNDGIKTLYLPSNDFKTILGFHWKNDNLIPIDTIELMVDPLIPLKEQYNFPDLVFDTNCI